MANDLYDMRRYIRPINATIVYVTRLAFAASAVFSVAFP